MFHRRCFQIHAILFFFLNQCWQITVFWNYFWVLRPAFGNQVAVGSWLPSGFPGVVTWEWGPSISFPGIECDSGTCSYSPQKDLQQQCFLDWPESKNHRVLVKTVGFGASCHTYCWGVCKLELGNLCTYFLQWSLICLVCLGNMSDWKRALWPNLFDIDLSLFSNFLASLQKSTLETELKGSFVELRKALFQMSVKDMRLLFTVDTFTLL